MEWGGGVGSGVGGSGLGGRDGCERGIEDFVKIKKNIFFWGGGGRVGGVRTSVRGGIRVDVNVKVKFCESSKKNGGGGSGRGVRFRGGGQGG